MRAGLIRSSTAFLRRVELAGGVCTALLGLAIFLRILSISISNGTSPEVSGYSLAFLMFVFPGLVVLTGSYLQARRRKSWAVALVFIGGACNLIFVGLFARFGFLYIQDKLGELLVWADIVVVVITLGVAVINMIVHLIFLSETQINNPVNTD